MLPYPGATYVRTMTRYHSVTRSSGEELLTHRIYIKKIHLYSGTNLANTVPYILLFLFSEGISMEARIQKYQNDAVLTQKVDTLVAELNHYRQQSETLQKVNTFYQRLSGVLDLPTMIETSSVWLMEHVPHDLIGYYSQTSQKMHMYCSSHGPVRKKVVRLAEESLKQPTPLPPQDSMGQVIEWNSKHKETGGKYVVIREKFPFTTRELEFVHQTCAILDAPLKRALEFEEVFSQARKDPLTNLPNRNVFNERITSFIDQANRYNHPLTLAALDIDHFKAVNDSMGHLYGDKILQSVARVLHDQIRLSDMLVRMGGDEFLLILPDTDINAAKYIAERLCKAVQNLDIQTPQGKMGVSIGLAEWYQELSVNRWLEMADDILYQAKTGGKSQVAY